MGKYVIESKFENTRCFLEVACENREPYFFINRVDSLTPYTEPDLEQVRKAAYEKGFDAGRMLNNGKYEKGINDAWEAARKIIHMPEGDLLNIFPECYSAVCTALQVILKYDAAEAIEKIRQYEQEKEMDGLRQNIQIIVDKCGYTLDEIATVLEKMRGEQEQ